MKKLFLLTLLSGLAGGAHAQTAIKAGTVQLGGNLGYSRTSSEVPQSNNGYYSSKTTTITSQFAAAPSVGYFVADNLAVGISGAYQINKYEYRQSGTGSSSGNTKQYQIGAFVQYYKMVSEQFGFTGTLGGGYQYLSQPFSYGYNDIPSKGLYANLVPSIVFFPIPKLAIGASIGGITYASYSYDSYSGPNSDSYKSSTFGANFGLSQLLFSGTYYFGR
jgi:hypothetical protein